VLAIKSTPKKQSYNRKKLAQKLEDLSERVAARGIYITRKNEYNQWDLYDYAQNVVIFDNLPNKDLAEQICARYNKNSKFGRQRQSKIRKLCNEISKHNIDCMFYLYTMQNTNDYDKYLCIDTRLQCSKHQIKKLIADLTQTII
jgi:3-methyladenine DNA glycosylase AlkC